MYLHYHALSHSARFGRLLMSSGWLNILTARIEEGVQALTILPATVEERFVVVIPHSGKYLPPESIPIIAGEEPFDAARLREFYRNGDPETDALYDLRDIGGTLIIPAVHRYAVDTNRLRADRGPHGVLKERGFDDEQIALWPYSEDEIEVVLTKYYDPLYRAIDERVARLRQRYGKAFVFSVHSMAEATPARTNGRSGLRPLFAILHTPDVDVRLITVTHDVLVRETKNLPCDSSRFLSRVAYNTPFPQPTGISQTYTRPPESIHSFELEVNRGLYYDELNQCSFPGAIDAIRPRIAASIDRAVSAFLDL